MKKHLIFFTTLFFLTSCTFTNINKIKKCSFEYKGNYINLKNIYCQKKYLVMFENNKKNLKIKIFNKLYYLLLNDFVTKNKDLIDEKNKKILVQILSNFLYFYLKNNLIIERKKIENKIIYIGILDKEKLFNLYKNKILKKITFKINLYNSLYK